MQIVPIGVAREMSHAGLLVVKKALSATEVARKRPEDAATKGVYSRGHYVREGRKRRLNSGRGILILLSRILPGVERDDWLEEHRAYLADLDNRMARCRWILETLVGMPRYAYTVRSNHTRESA
ncbi:hypothetical protein [Streptomyces sp. NBC_00370]|uniref:hypothetical protein n=1 Tax=Streptomyces sp. NBC_00370 TaxID=2975728 RepID=UPI002E25C3E7